MWCSLVQIVTNDVLIPLFVMSIIWATTLFYACLLDPIEHFVELSSTAFYAYLIDPFETIASQCTFTSSPKQDNLRSSGIPGRHNTTRASSKSRARPSPQRPSCIRRIRSSRRPRKTIHRLDNWTLSQLQKPQTRSVLRGSPVSTFNSFQTGEKQEQSSVPRTTPLETNPTPTEISSFLATVDVLRHHHMLSDLSALTLPARYTPISARHPRFRRILLEAKLLQTTLRHYNQVIPLQTPTVYVSSTPKELPIVIDTGASCSVTPNPLDYTERPTVADIDRMEGLSGNTAEVVGIGPVLWDIEDCKGIRDAVETTAYLVPSANIRLFSPQVYVAEQASKQNTHCRLVIDTEGAALTLANGTILRFPIAQGSNLPFMLTHKGVHPEKKAHISHHVRRMNRFDNLVSFLCSSAFTAFTGTTFQPVGLVLPTIIPNKVQDSPACA